MQVNLFLSLLTGLINSQTGRARPITLNKLFPGSIGLHFPPVEELNQATALSFPKFHKLNDLPMVQAARTYLKRGEVIVGWKENDTIKPLGLLFRQPLLDAVFHTKKEQWYTLDSIECKKLGPTRSLTFVRLHDEADAIAHLVTVCEEEPSGHSYTHEERVRKLKECQKEKYNKEYQRQTGGPSGGH